MKRVLYHGSTNVIEQPLYGVGNPHNDYGLGFYLTTNESLAKEWASKRTGYGYVNVYSLRDDNYLILDLTKPPYNNVLYWLALLIHNRELSNELIEKYPRELKYILDNYYIDVSKYDVVIGYRADDSYFQFPESFIKSEITLLSLEKIFASGELGKQYVIISKRAFKHIKFIKYYPSEIKSRKDYYLRKEKADKTYSSLLERDRYSDEPKLRDLIKNEKDHN